jgi:hypothetical protein
MLIGYCSAALRKGGLMTELLAAALFTWAASVVAACIAARATIVLRSPKPDQNTEAKQPVVHVSIFSLASASLLLFFIMIGFWLFIFEVRGIQAPLWLIVPSLTVGTAGGIIYAIVKG